MFRRDRAIPLRGSAAALCNNLSVLQQPGRNLTHLAVVHGPCAQLLSVVSDGVPLAQRQLHAKERAGVSAPLITQVRRPSPPWPLLARPLPHALTACPCALRSAGASSPSESCWFSLRTEEYR